MNLSNFIKSTVELHSNLLLKGKRQQAIFTITKLTLSDDARTILSLGDRSPQSAGLTLGQFRAQTRLANPQAKLWLVNSTNGSSSPLFGYYLRNQFLFLK